MLFLAFLVQAGLVYWFFWALDDTGILASSLTLSETFTLTAPVFVFTLLYLLASSRD